MYTINTSTKKITNPSPLHLGKLPAQVKIDFSLVDGEGNPVMTEGKSFSMTIGTVSSAIYKCDNDTVSFRYVTFTAETVSATSSIQMTMNGVSILDDTISLDYESGAQVQTDWNQADSSKVDYIKNKPTIPSITGLATETYVNNAVAPKITNPTGGTAGQVLTKTESGEEWADAAEGIDDRNYLCISNADSENSNTIAIYCKDSAGILSPVTFEYSGDRVNWTACTPSIVNGAITAITTVAVGGKIYLRGDNSSWSKCASDYSQKSQLTFVSTGKINVSGNIMSIVDKTCRSTVIPCDGCFYGLFMGQNSLSPYIFSNINTVEGLKLPATSLTVGCYASMFPGQGLAEGFWDIVLPAKTLAPYCYKSMFQAIYNGGVSGSKKAPTILAETLAENSMREIFAGAISLSEIRVCFTDWFDSVTATYNWLFQCPATLYIDSNLSTASTDASHTNGNQIVYTDVSKTIMDWKITKPSGGTAGQVLTKTASGEEWADAASGGYDALDYLCFTAGQANSTVRLDKQNNPNDLNLEYSTDKQNWTAYTWSSYVGYSITLTAIGDKVWFRGDNNTISNSSQYYHFIMTGVIYGSGNVMSLLDKSCNKSVISTDYCFQSLFENCTSLVTAPKLPSTTTTMRCYIGMFQGCTSLKQTPELPSLEVSRQSYMSMFKGCTSLETASYLPAQGLTNGSYYQMFDGCTSLKKIKTALTSFADTDYTQYWLPNNAGSVFECPSSLDVSTRDTSHVPSGWTVVRISDGSVANTAVSVEATTASTLEVSPSGEIAKKVTVSSSLTLSASVSSSSKIAYAELVLDIASGATVTAGTNLTFVDTPEVGKRNICVVRWSDGAAKLYVTIKEDLPQA